MTKGTEEEEESSRLWGADGRFALLGPLGAGGMGVVYEIYDRSRDMRLAVKKLRRPTPRGLLRFKDEFRALRDVRHPNLVVLGDLIEDRGNWYFTMEVVDGVDFMTFVRPPTQAREEGMAWPELTATVTRHVPMARGDAETLAEPELTKATIDESSDGRSAPTSLTNDGELDEQRLRHALAQLALGVAALHSAGKVHRDLKPSNILVERSGRLVILDFGVAASMERSEGRDQRVGTIAYMAPEQAGGYALSPAADWYAVGILIYRAITGRLPFSGAPDGVLAAKRRRLPPSPRDVHPTLPASLDDLAELSMALLAPEPVHRPAAAEILARLDAKSDTPSSQADGSIFIGRDEELARLHRALASSQRGSLECVVVEGESGVGKSTTVAAFAASVIARAERARQPPPLILRGRCHEREAVPYKAFDGVIDDLARHLAERDQELPLDGAQLAALLRTFPALGIAFASSTVQPLANDRSSIRSLAFSALIELLRRVAASVPTLVMIDDLQWADLDSLALLRELLDASPPPALLLLVTARRTPEAAIALAHLHRSVERISLQGLPGADAVLLARALRGPRPPIAEAILRQLVTEADGHPMFLAELVRQIELEAPVRLTLDEALRARVARLTDAQQRLMAYVAVAGAPVPHRAIAFAAAVHPEEYAREIDILRSDHLVRIRGAGQDDLIEPYHDRLREALYDGLDAAERQRMHAMLGESLEAAGCSSELLVDHFARGGELGRAATHAIAAGAIAHKQNAFERAADFYRMALRSETLATSDIIVVTTSLGESLQNAGRGREAAEAFAAAARLIVDDDARRLDLERRSAEQLLMGGYVVAGKAAAARVLAGINLPLLPPTTTTLLRLLTQLARFRLGKLRWHPRAASECPPEKLRRVDTFWTLGAGLCLVDTVCGMYYAARGLREALPAGEPFRLARASTTVSVVASALDQGPLARRLKALSADAAKADGTSIVSFYPEVATVVYEFLHEQAWERARTQAESALNCWKRAGMGRGFESDFATQFLTWSLAMQGNITRERNTVAPLVRDAARAGNRFLEVGLRVFHHQPELAADRPGEARRNVRDAIDEWLDEPGFQLPHCWAAFSLRSVALYEGRLVDDEADAALWQTLRSSVLLQIGYVRARAQCVTARLLIARALEQQSAGNPSEARALLGRARRLGKRLMRYHGPVSKLWAQMVMAGCRAAAGDEEGAADILAPLIDSFDAAGCELHAACTRYRLGHLWGGERGGELIAAASSWLARQGVVAPTRLVATIAPGWRD